MLRNRRRLMSIYDSEPSIELPTIEVVNGKRIWGQARPQDVTSGNFSYIKVTNLGAEKYWIMHRCEYFTSGTKNVSKKNGSNANFSPLYNGQFIGLDNSNSTVDEVYINFNGSSQAEDFICFAEGYGEEVEMEMIGYRIDGSANRFADAKHKTVMVGNLKPTYYSFEPTFENKTYTSFGYVGRNAVSTVKTSVKELINSDGQYIGMERVYAL